MFVPTHLFRVKLSSQGYFSFSYAELHCQAYKRHEEDDEDELDWSTAVELEQPVLTELSFLWDSG